MWKCFKRIAWLKESETSFTGVALAFYNLPEQGTLLWQLKKCKHKHWERGWLDSLLQQKKNVIENNFLLKNSLFFFTLFLGLPEFKNHIVALGAEGATVNSVKNRGALAIMKEEMP